MKQLKQILQFDETSEETVLAPDDTAYMQWSCQSGHHTALQIVSNPPAPRKGARFTVFLAS